jgi:hypothetical protein
MDLDIPEADSQTPINWPDPSSIPMPEYFWDKLKNICPYCECKGGILWRNLHRAEPHFDACFRYFDGQPTAIADSSGLAGSAASTEKMSQQRCFLKRGLMFQLAVQAADKHSLHSQGSISCLSTSCVVLGSSCQSRRQKIRSRPRRERQPGTYLWIHRRFHQLRHGTNSHGAFYKVAGHHWRP